MFNPFSNSFKQNPYPDYQELRRSSPICWNEITPQNKYWCISKYNDVEFILKDPRFVREYKTALPDIKWTPPKEQEELFKIINNWVLFRDPPAHTRLRKIINRGFQKIVTKKIDTIIDRQIALLLEDVESNSSFDFVTNFAEPLPVKIFAQILGIPDADWKKLKEWSDLIVRSFDISTEPEKDKKIGNDTILLMEQYFNTWINVKKAKPGEDLISLLVQDKGAEQTLSNAELMANLIFLLGAGHETTTSLIGNGLKLIFENNSIQEELRLNQANVLNATEEFLRYDSPIQMTFRIAAEDVDLNGNSIRKGQQICLLLGSANRDSDIFSQGENIDIHRENNSKHLAFGSGIHFCIGANLAKKEASLAYVTVLEKFNSFRIDDKNLEYHDNPSFRSLKNLTVSVS